MGLFAEYAPSTSNLTLVAELALGIMLIAGAFVVRAGHVRLHKYIQSSVVLVNIPIVLALMVPHYLQSVAPSIPMGLDAPFNLYPTIMLVAGAAAESLGVYIVLGAGTSLVPERFRLRNYQAWMRTELVLWWAVLLLGAATYTVWYS